MLIGTEILTFSTCWTLVCPLGEAPNTTQPRGDYLATRLAACLVTTVCRHGWSIPISRSTGLSLHHIFFLSQPQEFRTSFILTSDMLLLMKGIPTAVTEKQALFSKDLTPTRNILVVISSSFPPIFIVMVTSLCFKHSSSAMDKRIRLICAPESRSAFPCLLVLFCPRISTRTIGSIVCHR